MATLKNDLYTHLIGISAVTDLVSKRIYFDTAPEFAAMPYVTIQQISAEHEHHLLAASGLVSRRMQLSIWAATNELRESIREALRTALDGFRGTMGATKIRDCFLSGDNDAFEPASDGSQSHTFGAFLDFTIWHTETVPVFA